MRDLLLTFFLFSLGYLFFSLIDELIDRFIYKVKTVRVRLDVADYYKLKSMVKHGDSGLKVDTWLQFHFKEDIKDYLEGIE